MGKSVTPLVWCWIAMLMGMSSGILAEEPAERFLDALRERGYYDTALEYLDQIKESPLVAVKVKGSIPYQRGVILADLARVERNRTQQADLLKEAETAFKEFMAQQPNHALVPATRRQLGNLLVLRANVRKSQAEKESNAELRGLAVADIDAAKKVFQTSLDEMKPQLESMKAIPAGETAILERRRQLRDEYFQTLVATAGVLEEKARMVDEQSKVYKETLLEAATAYEKIYEKYRGRIGALYARMYQARCLANAGQLGKALAILENDILEQSDSTDAFRELRTRALILAMDGWIDESQKKYSIAATRGKNWKPRPNERGQALWLELNLLTARALQGFADSLKAKNPQDPQISPLLKDARDLAREVLRYPGPWKAPARQFLAGLPGGLDVVNIDKLPDTYDDAESLARETIELIESNRKLIDQQTQELAAAKDASEKRTRQAALEETEKTIAAQKTRAKQLVGQALMLGGPKLAVEDRTTLLYYLAYLEMVFNQPRDAIVIASYVAKRYPDASTARTCGQMALQAATIMYDQAPAEARQFEGTLVRDLANYLVDTWSETPEGVYAMSILVPFEIQDGHIDKAEELAKKMDPKSPAWASAQMRLGQAFWAEVLKLKQAAREAAADPENAGDPVDPKELEQLRKKAIGFLSQGTSRIGSLDQYDRLGAMSALYLTQAYVEANQIDAALKLLEDPDKGLSALVTKGKIDMLPAAFSLEVYQLTLRGLVQLMAQGTGGGKLEPLMERLRTVMADLDRHSGDSPEGRKKAIAVYYLLTRDLQQEIKQRANPAEKEALAKGAQILLAAVAERSTEANYLRWAGDAMRGLAESLGSSAGSDTTAKELYRESAKVYRKILDAATKDPAWIPADDLPPIRYWLAMMLQRSGDFPQAIEVLRDVLKEKNSMLTAQVAAAQAYELWAKKDKRFEFYEKALQGSDPSKDLRGANIIWGWIKLGKVTMRYKKFRETFHQAQYHRAMCQYELALSTHDAAKKKSGLVSAKSSIVQTYRFSPDMGGDAWRPQYDKLLKEIQKRLGEKTTGLKSLTPTKSSTRGTSAASR